MVVFGGGDGALALMMVGLAMGVGEKEERREDRKWRRKGGLTFYPPPCSLPMEHQLIIKKNEMHHFT